MVLTETKRKELQQQAVKTGRPISRSTSREKINPVPRRKPVYLALSQNALTFHRRFAATHLLLRKARLDLLQRRLLVRFQLAHLEGDQ